MNYYKKKDKLKTKEGKRIIQASKSIEKKVRKALMKKTIPYKK